MCRQFLWEFLGQIFLNFLQYFHCNWFSNLFGNFYDFVCYTFRNFIEIASILMFLYKIKSFIENYFGNSLENLYDFGNWYEDYFGYFINNLLNVVFFVNFYVKFFGKCFSNLFQLFFIVSEKTLSAIFLEICWVIHLKNFGKKRKKFFLRLSIPAFGIAVGLFDYQNKFLKKLSKEFPNHLINSQEDCWRNFKINYQRNFQIYFWKSH